MHQNNTYESLYVIIMSRTSFRVNPHYSLPECQGTPCSKQAPYLKFYSLAKWLSICLRTKWLWVRISLLLLKLQIWQLPRAGSFLTFKQTIECGSTLKLVRDMIRTYSQMHRADKYSEHSSIIWTIWLHG